MNKIYPFKFLDAYAKEDKQLFFGREEEIDSLYRMIFQTNILMVYGASGTGKTSLIQCGLAGKFQPHDWLALYIRRGNNINDSFDTVITNAGGTTGVANMEESFKAIYRNSFRPIYLIFDQFEELFILGTKEEQNKFMETVKAILKIEQPVKMIFSIREEYLGNLYEFEKEVPQLMRKKLRVEPMNLDKVQQVIIGVTKIKGSVISIKPGEERAVTEGIFDKIKGNDKTLTIQLPYLQVFLDKLYEETTHDQTHLAAAEFSVATITKMGDIGNVLRDFLEEQVLAISGRLNTTRDNIWKILSPFATLEGTKEPISMAALQERLQDMQTTLVNNAVTAFINARIVRHNEQGNIYELSHDSLAGQIAGKRTDEEKALLEVKRLIKTQVSIKADARELLTEKQLNFIDPFLPKLTLSNEEQELINTSRKKARTNKKIRLAQIGFVIMSIMFVFTTIYSFQQKNIAVKAWITAEEQKQVALMQKQIADNNKAIAFKAMGIAELARDSAERSKQLAVEQMKIAQSQMNLAKTKMAIAKTSEMEAMLQKREALLQQKKAEAVMSEAQKSKQLSELESKKAQQALDSVTKIKQATLKDQLIQLFH